MGYRRLQQNRFKLNEQGTAPQEKPNKSYRLIGKIATASIATGIVIANILTM